MPLVLWCLVVLLLIPYVLAALGGYYKLRHLGGLDLHHPRAQDAGLTGIGNRIRASQSNAWEALTFFIGCLLVASLRGAPLDALSLPALLFTATRLAYPLLYVGDLPPLRSAMVLVGLISGLYLAVWAG
ncbi:MAPEG family protein [Ferrimonas balearica]|uniref:MAPEG family protein n=1 Tax=Ferrimonas balearica TaxID=44012 RepID=UPI001C591B22|nr:MAPEG family protein [Ferrimonas balearica]MBW3138031.1 MAPEG family protein [Ferrimonas balearica]